MRAILVDWIIEVHQKFKLRPETLYITVNLVDRFLYKKRVQRSALQLVGVGAMLIACKYEEIYSPELRGMVYITDKSYSRDEILQMEYAILSTLNFDMLYISPYTFLTRFHFVTMDDNKSLFLAQYILEFSLLEYKMLQYKSSVKAAACLYISRKLLDIKPVWPYAVVSVSTYNSNYIKPCIKDICKLLDLVPTITLRACIHKFSMKKYMEVAKIDLMA